MKFAVIPALFVAGSLAPGCRCDGTGPKPAAPAAALSAVPAAQPPFSLRGAERVLTFVGACDASGAVGVSDRTLAVADDEDNVLRSYDAQTGGAPLSAENLSPVLGVTPKGKRGTWPETDLEAGTRIGSRAYWITSHGRNSKGQLRPERLRFFATTLPAAGTPPQVWGSVYEGLLQDLLTEPALASFDLEAASQRAPKAQGGLNIEGLSATPGGHLLIGFRNPIPEQRALIVPLLNPDAVLEQRAHAQFGAPIRLDLQGRGVRAIAPFRGREYIIVAGHYEGGLPSQVYLWDGAGAPRWQEQLEFGDFNPEAMFVPPSGDQVLLLSDDGERIIEGRACKKLRSPGQKQFRGAWVRIR